MDTSGSVKEEWTKSLTFAKHLVDLLPVGKHNVRVAGVAYSNFAYRQFDFNDTYSRRGLQDKINRIVYHDKNTNTSGGLRLTRREMFRQQHGDRKGVRDVGVLITDGMSNRESENLYRDSIEMHKAGIQVRSGRPTALNGPLDAYLYDSVCDILLKVIVSYIK